MIKHMRARGFGLMVAGASLLAVATMVTASIAMQDTTDEDTEVQESASIDLGSVLPEEIPDTLSDDAFEDLGENWDDWSAATAELAAELYENKELSDSERQDIISKLRGKLATIEKCLGDSNYAAIQKPLRVLRENLKVRLDLIDGLSNVVNGRQPGTPAVEAAIRDELVDSINYLDNYLSDVINGSPWRGFTQLEELRSAVEAGSSDEATLELVTSVLEKMDDGLDDADSEQKQFAARFPFARFVDSLQDYSELIDPELSAEDVFVEQVLGFVAAYEDYSETRSRLDAYRIRKSMRILDDLAPSSAGQIQSLIGERHLNDNLRFSVSEDLLSYAVNQRQNNSGGVADCILGAWVTGCQVSQADVTVDVQPNPDAASFVLRLNGVANSDTQGRKKPATIFTRGTHYFSGYKGVTFDGTRFTTSETRLRVDPNNCTTGIKTDFDRIPIVGCVVQKIARKQVSEQAYEAERIAAYKLAKEVVPRFDREVEEKFNKASDDVDSKLFSNLRRTDLYPERLRTSSSDRDISIFSRTMGDLDLGAGTPPTLTAPSNGFMAQVHESLINNALDRMNLAGRTLDEDELKAEIETAISDVLGRNFAFKTDDADAEEPEDVPELNELDDDPVEALELPEDDGPQLIAPPELPPNAAQIVPDSLSIIPVAFLAQEDGDDLDDLDEMDDEDDEDDDEVGKNTFVFDSIDPIRVKFGENGFTVVLQTGLQPEGKDEIPLQRITIPFTMEVDSSLVVITPGDVKISPLTKDRRGQFGRAAQIRRILEAKIKVREIELEPIEVPVESKASLFLNIMELYTSNGWLVISAAR
ncbi:MAG: hypothetical protein AB8G99_21390 [Planctomycetaceae bacterium]